jgi:hypothetical protein
MRTVITTLLVFVGMGSALAQFSFDGQYRARGEVRNGFKKPVVDEQEPAAFIEHRARLNVGFKKEKLGFFMSVQDVRIWGETGQINKSDNLLSTHEAYGDFYASDKSTFRIGRQEMVYDDHRLIGNLDWAMQARSFDAVRYMYKDAKGNQFDAMASWNQEGFGDGNPEPTKLVGNNYTTVSGGGTNPRIFNLNLPKSQLMAYYKKTFASGDLGIMLLNDMFNSNESTKENHSDFTVGITPNFKKGKLKLGGQFYYTGGAAGKSYNATSKSYEKIDLSGYMFNAYVQHTGLVGSPLLGVDYLSGDDASTTDKVEGWAPKYGTNHKFYGYIDYFYVGNGHGGVDARSAGLLDVYVKTDFKVGAKTKLAVHGHYFASAQERIYATTGESYKGTLGTELDLVLTHTFTPEIVLLAGYSQMFGITDAMKQLKFSNPNQEIQGMQCWGWMTLQFTPKFL